MKYGWQLIHPALPSSILNIVRTLKTLFRAWTENPSITHVSAFHLPVNELSVVVVVHHFIMEVIVIHVVVVVVIMIQDLVVVIRHEMTIEVMIVVVVTHVRVQEAQFSETNVIIVQDLVLHRQERVAIDHHHEIDRRINNRLVL